MSFYRLVSFYRYCSASYELMRREIIKLMATTKGYSPSVRNRDVCENRGLLAHLPERACRERDLYNL